MFLLLSGKRLVPTSSYPPKSTNDRPQNLMQRVHVTAQSFPSTKSGLRVSVGSRFREIATREGFRATNG